MPRDPRYILPNSLQHVVDETYQKRYLLCPSEDAQEDFVEPDRWGQQKAVVSDDIADMLK